MTEEKLEFQAEVGKLLDIVANSLYSHKEIFLRELISNAADACDRLRHAALTQPGLTKDDPDFRIRLKVDAKANTLTVSDNGIGMNRDDLVANLGTIARSGTAAAVEQLAESGARGAKSGTAKNGGKKDGSGVDDLSLIGQFGVGFYSAFMVASKVEVTSRKAGDDRVWRWVSDGTGSFTVGEAQARLSGAAGRGTDVRLHLRKDQKEFLEPERLRHVVRSYSDHIPQPIVLDGESGEETLNTATALWTRAKSSVTEEQYKEFYHHVSHQFDEPWLTLHFKAEGRLEYTGLLFVPSARPFDIFTPERKRRIKLYVRRVFITDECDDLIPAYLRFVCGVVDSEDLSLNISREMLQHDPMIAKIRGVLVKRVFGELKKKAEKAPQDYAAFWENFGAVLKEGLYEDPSQRDALLELARFRTTAGDGLAGLSDYVGRMKKGQEAIYYISGEDADALRGSPQLEGFVARGVEVLLLSDPVDEFWLPAVGTFDGKSFKSVTRGGADLADIAEAKAKKDGADEARAKKKDVALDPLVAMLKLELKDEVKDVRLSERLTDSAVCLVADEGDMDIHLERLLKQHRHINTTAKRILEINGEHPLVQGLAKLASGGELKGVKKTRFIDAAWLLLDQARIVEGDPLPDPAAFARRMSSVLKSSLGA